ncbi:hypothetical protein BDV37DRAFT_240280 [Aspergillus pseudonomiae]|uniref:Uncharacterized protein n=1 Tax=Aspergillus pseudonomiae TaxID=1506151 RepID=A0A5N7DPD9_9EURO|nr:uncharacterized protein BDV37DRAFT_240280 [Aspergillus pseudonomiae]KAE8407879.1 hypothetical protein BDV37DRAFT_240280 [Aspergillus pseudonomiae]
MRKRNTLIFFYFIFFFYHACMHTGQPVNAHGKISQRNVVIVPPFKVQESNAIPHSNAER